MGSRFGDTHRHRGNGDGSYQGEMWGGHPHALWLHPDPGCVPSPPPWWPGRCSMSPNCPHRCPADLQPPLPFVAPARPSLRVPFWGWGGSPATPHPIAPLQKPPPWCCAPFVPIPWGMEARGCILLAAPSAFLGSPPQSETETANGGKPKGPNSKKLNPKVPFPLLHILFGWQGVGNGMGAALQQVKPPAPLSPPA